ADYSTSNPLVVNSVADDMALIAVFVINQYTLTYTAGVGGSIDGATSQTVDHGDNGTTVTAVEDTGYHFVQWSDGVLAATRRDANVTTNISVSVDFAINLYSVAFQTDGTPGATLDGATTQTVAHGGDCTSVTAIAPAECLFHQWMEGGEYYSVSNPLTVTDVIRDMILMAEFTSDCSRSSSVKDWSLYDQ
ncbi:InlB B-repeat-containing protein, partial [Candidatus Sumerlaeota bacterium]|nr:InlB B-repeat-containing protein [Candidatus Sumerlaeota bacterium]